MNDHALPRNIMRDTLWSFTGDTFDSSEAFSEAVQQYHMDITGKDTWEPDLMVLPAPRVTVAYTYFGYDDEEEATIELTAANDRDFTALDLLFKIHNAVIDQLSGDDHHFFEGLSLNSAPSGNSPPLYLLDLGS